MPALYRLPKLLVSFLFGENSMFLPWEDRVLWAEKTESELSRIYSIPWIITWYLGTVYWEFRNGGCWLMFRNRNRAPAWNRGRIRFSFGFLRAIYRLVSFSFIWERREVKFNLSICIRAGIKSIRLPRVVVSVCYYFFLNPEESALHHPEAIRSVDISWKIISVKIPRWKSFLNYKIIHCYSIFVSLYFWCFYIEAKIKSFLQEIFYKNFRSIFISDIVSVHCIFSLISDKVFQS